MPLRRMGWRMIEFEAAVRDGASILTDGGIETRIMFERDVAMDPHVGVATLVGDPKGGPVLRACDTDDCHVRALAARMAGSVGR